MGNITTTIGPERSRLALRLLLRCLFLLPVLVLVIIYSPYFLAPSSTGPGSALNFPRLSFEENALTGVAIVNPSDEDAVVVFTAYGEDGQPLTGINNPVQEIIPANQQFGKLTTEIFGDGLHPDTVGWFQATSSVDDLTGFFLFLNIPLPAASLDGADLPASATKIVFIQVDVSSTEATELNIINPNTTAANLQLELIQEEALPISKPLSLPPLGVVRLDAATFFSIDDVAPGAYVTVTSDVDIAGFEFVTTVDGDLVGLNARDAEEQLTHLYFPQISILGPFETSLGVVNNSTQGVILTISAFKPDGSLYDATDLQTNPVTRSLDAGDSLIEDLESMFGFTGEEILGGWLQVESTSEAITGYLTYGTPQTGSSATVTPSRTGQKRAIISHLATVEDFFTGLAVLNAGQIAANLRIAAIQPSGEILGVFDTVLRPGERISKLVTELIPEAADQSEGLIWLKSDRPLHLSSVFGSTNVLANVPAQVAPDAYNPDIGFQSIQVEPTLAVLQPDSMQTFHVVGADGPVIWKVNGVEGGEPTTGTISPAGLYSAPPDVLTPQVVTVSAEVSTQTAGASIDVVDKIDLLSSEFIVQSVAYLSSLQKIYTAELAILTTSQNPAAPGLLPQQEITSQIFEVPAPGVPKILLAAFPNETISTIIPFSSSTGQEFLLMATQETGRILRFDPTTLESRQVIIGLNEPSALVIDPNNGNLLVADLDEVVIIEKARLESDLQATTRIPAADPVPRAITLFSADRVDGVAADRCTGRIYFSDSQAGLVQEFFPGSLRIVFSGLAEPTQLLALYRGGVGCPESFQLLVIERGVDSVRLLIPREGRSTPLISARQSTDLSFLPEGTPFARGTSLLLTELVDGQQIQQTGPRYALRRVRLPQYRPQPSNPVSKASNTGGRHT